MHTTTTNKQKRNTNDASLIVSKQFADVFQAYLECSDDIQAAIREMVLVLKAPDATEEEANAALLTIADALFPCKHSNELGVDLEKCAPDEAKEVLKEMRNEESTFSQRLGAALDARGITQGDLAAQIGVGQPAISMMLARGCRPQRRTIERIAEALKLSPEDLWPGFKED